MDETKIIDEMKQAAIERQKYLKKEKRARKRKRRWIMAGAFTILIVICIITLNFSFFKLKILVPDCPAEILEFVEKYPESASLVTDYPVWHKLEPQKELSAEDLIYGIPLFMQWDKRWAYQHYGDGFMGTTGCGPTSLAMVYAGLTGNTDMSPARMAEWADERGYYVEGIGSSWDLMSEGASALGLYVTPVLVDHNSIQAELWNGKILICSMHAGDFTQSGHFIVLTDIDEQDMVTVNDCNSRIRSEKKWALFYIIGQMDGAWSYEF